MIHLGVSGVGGDRGQKRGDMPTSVLSQLGLEGDDPLLKLQDARQQFHV